MHIKLFRFRRVMQEGAVLNLDLDLDTNCCYRVADINFLFLEF